jgi:hemerythrin-like metal-binding protein
MPFLEWSSSLSVGLESVDRQHRLLIGCINDLGDAVTQGRGGFMLQRVLERLRNYTRVHFAYEEAMFKVYDYESADDHAAAHAAFVRMLEACEQRHAAGEGRVGEELLLYLSRWLSDHIQVEDRAYARVLKARGAE